MLKKQKRILTACLLVLALLLSACASNNTDPGSESNNTSADNNVPSSNTPTEDANEASNDPVKLEPLQIELVIAYDGVEFPQAGNDAQKAIEEYTNTKLAITAYPGSTLHELLPTMIASDELPMVIGFGGSQLSKTYMINAMDSGVFWDLTDYIDSYPNISEISDITYKSYLRNGRIYGLPKERGLVRSAVGYRYDWIQNLGLEEPKTVDDLYDLMIAFTQNDPDGNGLNDTYGSCNNPTGPFAIFLGAPNEWKYENGEMIKDSFTEEHMQALDMTRELYSLGAIHPEYSIHSRSQYEALWTEGKAGMYFNVNNFAQFDMADPKAEVHVNGVFPSDKGTFTSAGTGHNGVLAISTAKVKDEETLKRILQFFDDLGDQEMCNLLALGIEGVHYTVADGVADPIEDMQDDLNQKIYMPYAAPIAVCYPDTRTIPVKHTYLQARILEVLEENLPYAVPNPTLGLISETYNSAGADLDTLIADAETQYIMGKITKEQYLAQLGLWKERGGIKIAEEYAGAYAEREGK